MGLGNKLARGRGIFQLTIRITISTQKCLQTLFIGRQIIPQSSSHLKLPIYNLTSSQLWKFCILRLVTSLNICISRTLWWDNFYKDHLVSFVGTPNYEFSDKNEEILESGQYKFIISVSLLLSAKMKYFIIHQVLQGK